MSGARKLHDEFMQSFGPEPSLSSQQFKFFADLMYEVSGVNLPPSEKNEALVKNRLAKIIRKYKFSDYQGLIDLLQERNPQVISEFVSALTTNKTHFFREEVHFEWFSEYLKAHFEHHSDLRVWCAAASTGQEPYTIAMVLRQSLPVTHLAKTKFLATDIDLQVLGKAAEGLYSLNEMEGCPEDLKLKYFEKVKSQEVKYRAHDDLAQMVHFAPLNLIQAPYPFQQKFHVIFCRNVLIYFDAQTTKRVIENLVGSLVQGGHLLLGHSESGTVKHNLLRPMGRAIYKKI